MLEFLALTAENFVRYQPLVMASEAIFPEQIRETPDAYMEALSQKGAQAYLAFCRGEYAGNVVGFPPCPNMQKELRFDEMETCLDSLIYLFNIVAMPQFHGQGVGKRMLRYFLEQSHAAGFHRLGGHFRGNGSLTNFTRFGGEVLASFDDWFGTGETYSYCELELAAALSLQE